MATTYHPTTADAKGEYQVIRVTDAPEYAVVATCPTSALAAQVANLLTADE
jgi:hypothetical protein